VAMNLIFGLLPAINLLLFNCDLGLWFVLTVYCGGTTALHWLLVRVLLLLCFVWGKLACCVAYIGGSGVMVSIRGYWGYLGNIVVLGNGL